MGEGLGYHGNINVRCVPILGTADDERLVIILSCSNMVLLV